MNMEYHTMVWMLLSYRIPEISFDMFECRKVALRRGCFNWNCFNCLCTSVRKVFKLCCWLKTSHNV